MTDKLSRADEIRANRRYKPGQLQYGGGRLSVDTSKLDTENFSYRFASDRGGRIQSLYGLDWDSVKEQDAKTNASTQGTVQSVHGGTEENGNPYQQILMKKSRVLFEDDQKEKQAPLDEIERQIKSGKPILESANDSDLSVHSYVPGGGNSINVSQGQKAPGD